MVIGSGLWLLLSLTQSLSEDFLDTEQTKDSPVTNTNKIDKYSQK